MKKAFLSIITPTYNRADKLHVAFNSLMAQTNKNFQWIIVDDGSSDNTHDVVSDFIKQADFKIIYKTIPHGGKHIATRAAYEHADTEWSLELDSDDEFYCDDTVKHLYKMTQSVSDDFVCLGGCFIDQNDNLFPKINGAHIDFDREKYLEYFCDETGIDMLNAPWLFRTKYAKSVLPPEIHDNLTYYPEAVVNVSRVLKCNNFHMRIFNQPIYRYYVYNTDSVSVNTYKTNADWYFAQGLLNVFYQYNLLNKHPKFTQRHIKKLFNATTKNKNICDVWKTLKSVKQLKYFPKYFAKYLIKQMFSVKRSGKTSVVTFLGITIKGKLK